jgi:hypothetical protein
MDQLLLISKASRNKLLSLVEDLSTDQLNYIPPGFKNNLAWQIGHIVVSQQNLCYNLTGNQLLIDTELVDRYKNGSKPEEYISEAEITKMKGYLINTLDQFEIDYKNGKFNNFIPYSVSTYVGVHLTNINDALAFIVSHDGLHYGCCLGLKKLVLQQ